MSQDAPPPPSGVRMPWSALPDRVREAVEAHLGAPVVEAVTQPGGFSPGVAARLRTADGRRAFVKGVGAKTNPDSPQIYRDEARITAALPEDAPVPRLRWSYDDEEWVALVLEDVEGRMPALPWRDDELQRVLDAVAGLAVTLTPSPIDAPPFAERFAGSFRGWRRLEEAGGPPDIDPWARSQLGRLAELEGRVSEVTTGTTLLHSDLRADNLLLTPERVLVVDWPWACVGAPWVDLLLMLPSVAMQGGRDPEAILATHDVSRETKPEAINAVLAAATGYFVWSSLQPPPPGLPTVRAFQAAQGHVALAWLRRRLEQA